MPRLNPLLVFKPSSFNHCEFLPRRTFDEFVHPSKPIDPAATKVNSLALRNGALVKIHPSEGKGDQARIFQKIVTETPSKVLSEFVLWLKAFKMPVILVSHNGFRFDFKVSVHTVHMIEVVDGLCERKRVIFRSF